MLIAYIVKCVIHQPGQGTRLAHRTGVDDHAHPVVPAVEGGSLLDVVIDADKRAFVEIPFARCGEGLQMGNVALAFYQSHADSLDQILHHRIAVHFGAVEGLHEHAPVVPGEFPLRFEELLVVADREILERTLMGDDEARQFGDSGLFAGGDDHHGHIGACFLQEGNVTVDIRLPQQIRLIQHDQVGFFQLQFQQIHQLFGKMDVRLLGHDHAQALGIDDHREGRKRDFPGALVGKAMVHMIERSHAATGNIGHDEEGAFPIAQAADLVDHVVHLIADAARCDFLDGTALRLGELGIHQVRTQVVRNQGDLPICAIHVLRQGDHRSGLARPQKPAHNHEADAVGPIARDGPSALQGCLGGNADVFAHRAPTRFARNLVHARETHVRCAMPAETPGGSSASGHPRILPIRIRIARCAEGAIPERDGL